MPTCPHCRKYFHSLGYARHLAMHRDNDRKAKFEAYSKLPDDHIDFGYPEDYRLTED